MSSIASKFNLANLAAYGLRFKFLNLLSKYLSSTLCCTFRFFGTTFELSKGPVIKHYSSIDKRIKWHQFETTIDLY